MKELFWAMVAVLGLVTLILIALGLRATYEHVGLIEFGESAAAVLGRLKQA